MSSMHSPTATPTVRTASSADADTIAALHVASWRTAYRGILADAYLDGPVEAERRALWCDRLRDPTADQVLLVAEAEGALAGFVCCFADHDARWGFLHPQPPRRSRGTRSRNRRTLMAALARELEGRAPKRPVYLHCLAANAPARRFYERIGGEIGVPRSARTRRAHLSVPALCLGVAGAAGRRSRVSGFAAGGGHAMLRRANG